MHLAVNATIVDPRSSGLGVYTIHLVRELSQLLPSMTVFSSTPELLLQDHVQIYKVTRFVRPSYGFGGHLARILWSNVGLRHQLKRKKVSVLLSPTPLEAILDSPVPQVVVVHDLLPLFFPAQYPRQRYFFRAILPKILKSAEKIIADSQSTRDDIINAYNISPEKISVVYIGYNNQLFQKPLSTASKRSKKHPPYALYVGNLFPHKNLHRLIEAFAIASRQIPHGLIIVGYKDPRFYPSLSELVKRSNLTGKVKFVDYASQDELALLYQSAEVFVFPSLYEGFGMPPLEAMACGVPVLTSSTKAIREVLDDAALVADPYDLYDIAKKLVSICKDKVVRDQFKRKGMERVKHFSWRQTAEQLLCILKEVAA